MNKFIVLFLAVVCLCWTSTAFAKPNPAQLEAEGIRVWQMLPRASEMIRHPGAESWEVYGTEKTKLISVPKLPGGEAKTVRVKKVGQNPWDIGANAPTQVKTQAGDVLFGAFWARAPKIESGSAQTQMPFSIQQMGGDYEQYATDTAVLTSAWNQYFIYTKIPKKMRKGGLGLAVHLSGAAHEIELGPVYIMNMGQGDVDVAAMPKSTYGARPIKKKTESVIPVQSSKNPIVPAALSSDYAAITSQFSNAVLLGAPDVKLASVFGENETHRMVRDAAVPGGDALEITVKETGENSWSTGVNWATQKPIRKGDVVFLAYWAKGIEAKNEAQTPIISPIRIQQSGEPYLAAASGAAYLSRDWKLYYTAGKSEDDIAPGGAGITFHMGLTKQTLRLGPAYLLNLGPNTNVTNLPRNKVSYDGQALNAPWRASAKAKIETHRKGDLTVRVVDANGGPMAGVTVKADMTEHAFNFGTFVGHKFVDKDGKKNTQYHQSFEENFNMATLPLYWQDWGWNGKNTLEGNYRKTVKYASDTGMRWRGHPIIWPGEDYMPSRILNEKGNPKKQREMVLDHVREVMEFIAPHDPIAIDLVNEVRVNQYFKKNGNKDLVEEVFRLAQSIAPDVPLYVNDYAILNNGGLNESAIEFYHNWIKDMQRKDVPLGGIGFQGHFGAGLTPPQRVIDILGEFAQYGLPLQITEFDVETYDEQAQADYTRDMLYAAFSEPALDAFIVWGWWEGDHWKKPAAMLREDWSEKPSFKAWRQAVFSDWWSRESGVTNNNGEVIFRGFKGTYDVTVGGQTVAVTLSDQGEAVITLN